MSWYALPIHSMRDAPCLPMPGLRPWAPAAPPLPATADRPLGLGCAYAGRSARWAGMGVPDAPAPLGLMTARRPVLRVPAEVMRYMAEAACELGTSEDEVWIAAAREWLSRRARDDDPPPSAPAAAAPPCARRTQTWAAIDATLADLRHGARDAPVAQASQPTNPAITSAA